jgi:hypothetical protein
LKLHAASPKSRIPTRTVWTNADIIAPRYRAATKQEKSSLKKPTGVGKDSTLKRLKFSLCNFENLLLSFPLRKSEWILVVGGRVVRSSSNLEKLPSKKEIYQVAKKQGFAPLLFIKNF